MTFSFSLDAVLLSVILVILGEIRKGYSTGRIKRYVIANTRK